MRTEDTHIVLRRDGDADDLIVGHPGQPGDYVHTDGTVWTWRERWRLVGGEPKGLGRVGAVHLRAYDLVTRRPEVTA